MSSVLKEFRNRNLNYTAYYLTEYSTSMNKYNVFVDDSSNFRTNDDDIPDQWWQVSFEIPATISSYIIKASSNYLIRPTNWIVNSSFDNKTWDTVSTINDADIYSNKTTFQLSTNITCMHFRIITRGNYCSTGSCSLKSMVFSFFDAFEKIATIRNQVCTCKRKCLRRTSIAFAFIFSFVNSYV